MKPKILIVIALIIALAAMAAPVMAIEATPTLALQGLKTSSATLTIPNASSTLTFASFGTSATAHHISPSEYGSGNTFATADLTTNEEAWHIYAYEAGGDGKMAVGTNTLDNALAVTLASSAPSGMTLTPITALTGSNVATFIEGSKTFETTEHLDLDISQLVTANDGAGTYQITLTLRYVTA